MPVATDPAADRSVCVTDRRRRTRRSSKPATQARSSEPKSRDTQKPRQKRKAPKKVTAKVTPEEPSNVEAEETAPEGERRSQERRRQIDPTTCERDYKPDEIEFMTAMDDYKRRSGRPFPTWSEVLEVLRDLGYRKVAAQTQTYAGEE